ncbi:SAM-dependent methyltransferase (plasmid) [Sphingomonas sp. NY01]|uniref:SAM-dependent methyltransferase n=1 Tax=Sphingomonas sp. NY01 TaxID=2968057 RepID=UPI00315DFA75
MTPKLKPFVTAERPSSTSPLRASMIPGSRAAHNDTRWADICTALTALRDRGRHAIRIVDADCACATLLIEVMRHAKALGFTAIEGRGIDGSPAMIGRARAAAGRLREPAIGLTFEVADMIEALASEADFPADIVLWHGGRPGDDRPGLRASLAKAGDLVIGDHDLSSRQAWAA